MNIELRILIIIILLFLSILALRVMYISITDKDLSKKRILESTIFILAVSLIDFIAGKFVL